MGKIKEWPWMQGWEAGVGDQVTFGNREGRLSFLWGMFQETPTQEKKGGCVSPGALDIGHEHRLLTNIELPFTLLIWMCKTNILRVNIGTTVWYLRKKLISF